MLRLILFIFFCLLAAACSQVASGTADDDEADALSSENINGDESSSSDGLEGLESSGSNEKKRQSFRKTE